MYEHYLMLPVFSERELMFAICYSPSVVQLSVTFVHPTYPVEIFRSFFTPVGTSAIC